MVFGFQGASAMDQQPKKLKEGEVVIRELTQEEQALTENKNYVFSYIFSSKGKIIKDAQTFYNGNLWELSFDQALKHAKLVKFLTENKIALPREEKNELGDQWHNIVWGYLHAEPEEQEQALNAIKEKKEKITTKNLEEILKPEEKYKQLQLMEQQGSNNEKEQ